MSNFSIRKSQKLEKIVTPSALIILDGDVVKTYTNPSSDFTDESANQNAEAILDLLEEEQVFHMVVPDSTTLITLNPRDYRNAKFESRKRAEAIVIKSLGHRMLANFYVKERINDYPVRIFDDELEAIDWFNQIRLG